MPTIARKVSGSSSDALNGLQFKVQGSWALVTLAASSASAGDTLSFKSGNRDVVVDAEINLESANEVVDMQRDIILAQERIPPGEYYMPMTIATDASFVLIIDPVPGS